MTTLFRHRKVSVQLNASFSTRTMFVQTHSSPTFQIGLLFSSFFEAVTEESLSEKKPTADARVGTQMPELCIFSTKLDIISPQKREALSQQGVGALRGRRETPVCTGGPLHRSLVSVPSTPQANRRWNICYNQCLTLQNRDACTVSFPILGEKKLRVCF